jgi:lipid-A-disaccharide synthase
VRIFASTGEASGDMMAAALAEAVRAQVPDATFEGIGGERMRAAGFRITADTSGWASMGPLAAIPKIAPLWVTMARHALALRNDPPSVVVLVDFGAFNLRLAKTLRILGHRGPIVYFFPPGAMLDRYKQAHAVARYTAPLSAFARQREYYRWLGLPCAYFGHPLVSLVAPRVAPAAAPADGGTVALLPGSRAREIERHLPRLLGAFAALQARRAALRGVVSAADEDAERQIAAAVARTEPAARGALTIARGANAALDGANAAWIASGTAVLEGVLREVPTVALYVVSPREVEIGRRMWRGPYITLPNILLGREAIPELLQDAASPDGLAAAIEPLLADSAAQLDAARALRAALGPPDALQRCAAFVIAAAHAP